MLTLTRHRLSARHQLISIRPVALSEENKGNSDVWTICEVRPLCAPSCDRLLSQEGAHTLPCRSKHLQTQDTSLQSAFPHLFAEARMVLKPFDVSDWVASHIVQQSGPSPS